jgi:hypothetical protein
VDGRRMKKRLFFWLFPGLAGVGALVACPRSPAPATPAVARQPAVGSLTFQNPRGEVVFRHDRHRSFPCSRCHPPFDERFDDTKDYSAVAHQVCIACHESALVPADCSACHQATPR